MRVYVRKDAFGESPNEYQQAWLVSVRAVRGRPFVFQVWVDEYAACYDKVAPHHLFWKLPAENDVFYPLHKIQIWECLSGSIEMWRKDQFADSPVLVNIDGKGVYGRYLFTLDFCPEGRGLGNLDVGDCELLEEHKEANVIKMSNGQIAIYPNNRLKWMPSSLTPRDAPGKIPTWEVACNEKWESWYNCEEENLGDEKWAY